MKPTQPMLLAGIVTFCVALVFGRIAIQHWRRQGRPFIDGLGLAWQRGSAADLSVGFLIAAFAMAGIYACELASGHISRDSVAAGIGLSSWRPALILIFGALEEECVFRGLLLSGLTLALGGRRTSAVWLTALMFGLVHLANPAAGAMSVLGNALGGLIYGYAFVLSGRLWLPLGLHFGWNFVQGPVLGFPVSGLPMGGMQHIQDLGPAWLTGGSYGPEAGLVGIAFRFLVLALLLLYLHRGRMSERRREILCDNSSPP
jgi:membrane protease YdiL (CAAX protease family)